MPSLIANCLARLVKQGLVSAKAAKDAEALHDGMQGKLGEEMGAASADAVAALEAARIMGEQARARKVSIAKQAIALQGSRERMVAHPRGAVAGLNGILARDIFGKGAGTNIDSLTEVVFAKADRMFGPGNEALGSKLAGLRQDKNLARLVTRENFGDDTGNAVAKQIVSGWRTATDYLATRAQAAGRMFNMLDEWRQPQFWTGSRVKHFGETAFTADITDALRKGGLRLVDKETGATATPMQIPQFIKAAYHDISTGSGLEQGGSGLAFSPQRRLFRFAEGKEGADAYLTLMEKYGPGADLYSMLRGHLHAASREIALTETLGPSYRANFNVLHAEAKAAEKGGTAKKIPLLSSAYGAQKTFKLLTGELNAVENEAMAGIMAGGRAWLTAVQLGSATLSAVPGDMATIALSAHHNGIPAAKIIADTIRTLAADSPDIRAEAARLGVIAYASADTALTQARFADQWLDPRFAGKVANSVIRLSGLQAWTEAGKRATTMALLGKVAAESGKGYKAVSKEFRAFLDRYGISAKEWDALRQTPLLDVGGATFFDTGAVANQTLGEKLMSGIIDERHFFVLEPTALERAVLAPSAPRGTLTGEMARSFGMYKTFAVAMMTTHMMRAATQSDLGSKIGYGLALAGTTTMFGAMAIAMKDIASGKDPRRMFDADNPMNTASFWLQAAVQGGGLGILGDFLNQGFSRADTSLAGTLAGPLAAAVDAGSQLIFPQVRKLVAGDETNFGAELAKQVRRNLIPTTWFTRLATDRLFTDQVMTLVDPNYRKSWKRTEDNAKKNTGNSFWWKPGTTGPQRPPNPGNVIQ